MFNTFEIRYATETERHLRHTPNQIQPSFTGRPCAKMKVILKVKTDSKPVFRPKRLMPYATLATVEKERNRLQQSEIIEATNYPLCVARVVFVKKANGKLRLFANFSSGLNRIK